ncbi:MAG: NAD-dependent epimerase/dehydratase family protein, partial [Caldilineae bacterium]
MLLMDILLIGGSGFVSGTTARLAVEQGHQVWAVTRGQRPLPAGVTGVQVDRKDRAAFGAAIRRLDRSWDLVVDCIGYEPADAEQDLAVFRERTGHFVFISTDFVYDPARRRFPQPEDDADYLSDGYGGRKRQCELRFIQGDSGPMRWTILRPCHIYGPGSQLGCLPEHSRDPELVQRLRRGETLRLVGGGHFLQQPIFVADLARVILACGENSAAHGAVCNVAGPDIIESRTYYQIIADELGV